MSRPPDADLPIAVVGVGALFPGSVDAGAFWAHILAGRDFMTEVPPDHWLIEDYHDPDPAAPGKTYARRGGFLPPVPFDPLEHGLPPRQLSTTDTAQLLALNVAQKVLEDTASVQSGRVQRRDIGVILGVASATELVGQMAGRIQRPHWVKALRDAGLPESQVQDVCRRIEATYPEWDESTFPGLLGNVVAGRIANRLDLGGTNCVVDAACASSLAAVSMAVQELRLGRSKLVITGGVDALNDIFMFMCFSRTPALSPSGDCRPFAEAADGTLLGEGLGMLALRRLDDAERDGDRIYAVLRGIGSSSDGRHKSIYAPVAQGQAMALRRAYESAGYGPREVGLVEAHGTATKAGDLAEFEGLRAVFGGPDAPPRPWCALGSVKSQIGHTKAAAGAASLFKVVMALHHKVLPPTIKVDRPNEKLDIARSPFYLNTEARPWVQPPGRPRRGSVSSFGFGGSNFHVTLEEYAGAAPPAPRLPTLPAQLLLVAAADAAATVAGCEALAARVAADGLAAAARASQRAFDAAARCRLALVAADAAAAQEALAAAAQRLRQQGAVAFSLPPRLHFVADGEAGRAPPAVAFLFPGQGSQYPNMGRGLAIEFDAARAVWDEAAALALDAEARLDELVFPVPVFSDEERRIQAERLTRTEWAQPAIGAASLALLRLLQRLGVRPQAVAGHSYGELVALHAAGAIGSAAELLRLSRRRGELMRDAAARPGAMLAVHAGADAVRPLLAAVPGLTLANVNSPRQVVVAGETAAVQAFEAGLPTAGLRGQRLPVATAFHTPLVADSAVPWRAELARSEIGPPRLAVYGNTHAAPYPDEPEAVRDRLGGQLAQPVQFAAMVRRMHDDGLRLFVEVGPGSALSAMVGDILAGLPHAAVALDHRRLDAREALLQGLAVLAAQGVPMDLEALWQGAPLPAGPARPRSPATVMLTGANHGKPYPPRDGAAGRPAPNPEAVLAPVPAVPSVPSVPSATPAGAGPFAPAPAASPMPAGPPSADARPRAGSVPTAGVLLPTGEVPHASALPPEAWSAFEAMQRQSFEAHAAFTQALAESHQAFLRASEAAFVQIAALGGVAAGAPPGLPAPALAAPHAAAGLALPAISPLAPPVAADATASAAPAAVVPVGPAAAAAPMPPPAAAPAVDVQALLMQVVADKTGYPVEMLSPEMELEAGLGIDSIKRVEILSALQERLPQLAQVDTGRLAALNTLGEIVEFARHAAPAAPAAAAPSPPAAGAAAAPVPAAAGASAPAPSATEVQALLMRVVADKTGYPVEMLAPEMELEAGLGIDSIKRVEILSALQAELPQLAQADTGRLAALNTLGEIVAFARGHLHGGAAPAMSAAPPASTRATEPSGTLSEPTAAGTEPFTTAASPAAALRRAVVTLQERPAPGFVAPGLEPGLPLVVAGGPPALAQAVAARLAQAGLHPVVAAAAPADARALLLLTGLADAPPEPAGQAALNEAVFAELKAVAATMAGDGRLLVTVQDTGGDFGIGAAAGARAWSAGIAAAARTAALEWPGVCVRAIDLDTTGRDTAAQAEALCRELLTGGDEPEAGLPADGRRLAPVLDERPEPPALRPWDPAGVLVVSGGARGVTPACLAALLARQPMRLAILGRTPLADEPPGLAHLAGDAELKRELLQRHQRAGQAVSPRELAAEVQALLAQRELRAGLRRLAEAGAQIEYLSADVGDAAQVRAALEQVRSRLGPVRGLVHAAGVLADREIRDKTAAQVRAVMRTKVDGLRHLLDATAGDTLTHLLCFSSVAAWHGNAGQVDYAMANQVLNRVCRAEAARRGAGCRVVSIGWGPWDGGMVDATLARHFAARGVALIPLQAGAEAFAREFAGEAGGAVEVLCGGGLPEPPPPAAVRGVTLRHSALGQPWLADHAPRGLPVVPMAAVLVAALRALDRCAPGGRATRAAALQVQAGIPLPDLAGGVQASRLDATPAAAGGGRHELRVNGLAGGRLQYALQVEAGDDSPLPVPELPAMLPAWQPASGRIYDGRLFHGPRLQVIDTLLGRSDQACRARLRAPAAAPGAVPAPVALLDGGLQMLALWAHDQRRCETLPTALDEAWIGPGLDRAGSVVCEALCRSQRPLATTWDLAWRDADGQPLAVLRGVVMHSLPEPAAVPGASAAAVAAD